MKRFNITLIVFFLITFGVSDVFSQELEADKTSNKPYQSQTYFSFGAGISFLHNVPENFYQDGHGYVQLGLMKEFPFNKKLSFITGIEFERVTYNLDIFPILDEVNSY